MVSIDSVVVDVFPLSESQRISFSERRALFDALVPLKDCYMRFVPSYKSFAKEGHDVHATHAVEVYDNKGIWAVAQNVAYELPGYDVLTFWTMNGITQPQFLNLMDEASEKLMADARRTLNRFYAGEEMCSHELELADALQTLGLGTHPAAHELRFSRLKQLLQKPAAVPDCLPQYIFSEGILQAA